MTGRPERSRGNRESGRQESATPNAVGTAHIDLAKALTAVFSSGVYNKEELQAAVCTYVSALKHTGETGDGVVRATQGLVTEIGTRFSASDRAVVLLADMVSWCLAEYYRESA
jgi:hypothetical protein